MKKDYYLGLDIGTDSVGYAVTDENYNLIKFHGEPAWGATIFDEASGSAERRSFRTARRRLDRRQQRVSLLQELFAKEIETVDPGFFIRIKGSSLYRDEINEKHTLFNDADYTDVDYHREYPTIHHLIVRLMDDGSACDIRLVYLACAWLVAHRGHFLSNISVENLDQISDFKAVYVSFIDFFADNGYDTPWMCENIDSIGEVLKSGGGVVSRSKALIALLFDGKKPGKEYTETFPFSREAIIKLLAGGTCKLKDLFLNDDYEELGSLSLTMDDEKLEEIMGNIGDDYALVAALRQLTDWALLADILVGDSTNTTISKAKVKAYEKHQRDLKDLKYVVKKYIPEKYYEIFRAADKANYAAYSYHGDGKSTPQKKCGVEDFCKFILAHIKSIVPESGDKDLVDMIRFGLEERTFMPKQKNTDNRVIPYQLYAFELKKILDNASAYLDYLNAKDDEGISVREKIDSVFSFRIPYFVGPLNPASQRAWIVRKAGKIYPWNFDRMVDLDASEQAFIDRLTNKCTYLPGETVLPKDSLLYHRFTVLNTINNIRINGEKISVELKQRIYDELFMTSKNVTRRKIVDFLVSNGELVKGEESLLSGIDDEGKLGCDLAPQMAFRKLLADGHLTEEDVECIIERASYAEDKSRLSVWLDRNYPALSEADKKYICRIRIGGFGRLSRRFLTELEGVDKSTGEVTTIMAELWDSQNNLMELLSDKYTFKQEVEEAQAGYYTDNAMTLTDRLNEMYVPNGVKRSVFRTMAIVKDIEKAFGAPKKIFVEVTRGGKKEQKGKRTLSRKQQILDLYSQCKDEDVRILKQQLDEMGEYAENRLQGDKLFLYYMQLGKCMYSGASIELEKLGSDRYNIDHIYPQAYVKDDSIINNKVLVLSTKNGTKDDVYPIASDVRHKMSGLWSILKERKLISDEKYKRLIRSTAFTADEKQGFINRQLTETSQSVKAVATILGEKYPEAQIVYCKAWITSEFRQEFDLIKSRSFNDLHHAVDAYLNIVTGNVYDMKFSKRWFSVDSNYSIKTKTIFTKPLIIGDKVVWEGEASLERVKKTASKCNAHFTVYSYMKTGGLFDQMPVRASEGLVPMKKGQDTSKYGGYNRPGVMFFMPVKYTQGKKSDLFIMSVEMLYGKKFLSDPEFAVGYSKDRLGRILGKKVDSVEFPLGMRPWKINTMLSLNGYLVSISGSASAGRCVIAKPAMQFKESTKWSRYVKRLESFIEKSEKNANYIYSEEYDKISEIENVELYKLYIDKYCNTVMKYRVNAPVGILRDGFDEFKNLSVLKQAMSLLSVHQSFGRSSSGGVNLKHIGGAEHAAATVNFSSKVSNWKKLYSDVRLVDSSVSGLWTQVSDTNLLDLV